MAEKIKVDIAASYDDKEAKKALKDAEAIDKLKPEMEISADVQRVLSAFDQVEAEAKAVAATAEVLSQALGPELAAKADVTSVVNDLRQMGLTMDDIKGNADTLGAKLKELSDADVGGKLGSSLGTARGQMDDLGKSADSSRSVLANMVGNATQDIGALAGISGSAGVAIGQMGEYMLDAKNSGDSMGQVFKNFAQVAGPIAAISGGIFLLKEGMAAYKKESLEAEARTKALGEAMADSSNDALGFADVLREDEKALTDFISAANDPLGGFGVWVDEVASKVPLVGGVFKEAGVDIFDTMRRAELSMYDFAKAIDGSQSDIDNFVDSLERANREGKITDDELRAGKDALDKYGDAANNAAEDAGLFNVSQEEANAILQEMIAKKEPLKQFTDVWAKVFSDIKDGSLDTKAASDAVNELADKLGITREEVIGLALAEKERRYEAELAAAATEHEASAQEIINAEIEKSLENMPTLNELLAESAERHRDAAAAIQEEIDAQRAAVDSTFALHDAEADFAETQATVNDELKEAKDLYEARSILENYAQSAGKVADAMVRVADDTATANGKVLTAQQRTDIWNDSMLDAAATMDGPQRTAVLNYVAAVNDIPPEKLTEIESLIDQGKLDEAKRKLDEVSATRKAAIEADAQTAEAEENLNRTARPRTAEITVVSRGGIRYSAAGSGNFGGGSTWVGEDGPELVNLPSGSQIIPANVSSAMAHNGQAGAAPMVVNINMPKGSRGVDVLRQVTQQARRSGRRYGTPVVHYARR